MNHHLPAAGPLPPATRRQPELPYSTAPPNMRSPPAYMPYHHPHMNGHPSPAYSPQQYPQWYPAYPQPQVQMPPRPYQPPYGPLIISSYPPSQPAMGPAPVPPPSLPSQPPRISTPFQSTMSPSAAAPPAPHIEVSGHSPVPIPINPLLNVIPSPALPAAKPVAAAKPPFRAPVSL